MPGGAALHGGDFQVASLTVAGIDVRKPALGLITRGQITEGRYLTGGDEAIVDVGYARQTDIEVGDKGRSRANGSR
jgi:hypothetical protein